MQVPKTCPSQTLYIPVGIMKSVPLSWMKICSRGGKASMQPSSYYISTKCRQLQKKKREKDDTSYKRIRARIKRLKADIKMISEEQKRIISEGRQEMKNELEKIETGSNQLKEEIKIITDQNADIQLRISLLFAIVKARQENNSVKADNLLSFLRESTRKQNH